MPFIGNQPSLSYTSFAKQDFTTSATTSYTLDNPVTNENELALFINFVRQEPTTAYTASGTSLTLTSATSASDDMYCVFLGKAIQTVNPPSGSVGTAQIADLAVTSGKLASGVLPDNTPAFRASMSATQNIGDDVRTLVQYDTVDYDTDSAYDNSASNYKFTIPSGKGGKYVIYAQAYGEAGTDNNSHTEINIYKNGSILTKNEIIFGSNYINRTTQSIISTFDLSAGDYIQIYLRVNDTSGTPQILRTSNNENWFGAYKLIGV